MAQTKEGALKVAAVRAGCSVEQYRENQAAGLKYCWACKSWHPVADFTKDSTRKDGLSATCRASRSTGRPVGWHGRPSINPATDRPGPTPKPARDGDRKQARQRINAEVRSGRREHPNFLPCTDCGHVWRHGERRHEYDHHRGYSAAHHLDVQPVCTTCHAERERARGINANRRRTKRGMFTREA